eukprot:7750114-Pyramimonas_sp.AAC.2
MLAGPKGRAVGESGELDTGWEKVKGLWGVESSLAVIGTGGPVLPGAMFQQRTVLSLLELETRGSGGSSPSEGTDSRKRARREVAVPMHRLGRGTSGRAPHGR